MKDQDIVAKTRENEDLLGQIAQLKGTFADKSRENESLKEQIGKLQSDLIASLLAKDEQTVQIEE